MSVFEDIKTGLLEAIEYEKGNIKAETTRIPNNLTVSAIKEGRRIAYDSNSKGFKHIDDLRKDLEV
ncbi:MAG: hypothetical protein J6C23_03310 [Clostridia bacterium]|nr:hypothetical protein [Clostridia bacterium]